MNKKTEVFDELIEEISNSSHTIKNSLAVIKAFNQLLSEKSERMDPKEKKQYYEKIDGHIEKITVELDNLIKRSRSYR